MKEASGIHQKLFIHNQRLFRLELTPAEATDKLKYLRLEHLPDRGVDVPESEREREQELDKEYRSRWREITVPRHLVLSQPGFAHGSGSLRDPTRPLAQTARAIRGPTRPLAQTARALRDPSWFAERTTTLTNHRQLLCISAAGGIGKSIALGQLIHCRSNLPGHLVISLHISQLPNQLDAFLDQPITRVIDQQQVTSPPVLIQHILDRFLKLGPEKQPRWPVADPDQRQAFLKSWLTSLIRMGQLTLTVDGLDELPVTEGLVKVKALRKLLDHYRKLHCVVAGRPHAINTDYWLDLFATNNESGHNDKTSPWEFYLAGLFDNKQIELSLGARRYEQLRLLQGNIEFNARTLDILRTLPVEIFRTLRSGADVYWHSIRQSLLEDVKKEGQKAQTELKNDEILDILSAIAITMLMWNHDPLAPVVKTRDPRRIDAPVSKSEPQSEPTGQITRIDMSEFYRRVYVRLASIYPAWQDGEFAQAKAKVQELKRLNTHYLEIGYLIDSEESLSWRNVTQRDFFAALWMIRSASEVETDWFAICQSSVLKYAEGQSRHEKIAEAWRFICGMPDEAFLNRGDFPPQDRWLDLVHRLFSKPDAHSRSNELMYLAWPNLLRRAGLLRTAAWSEADVDAARDRVLQELSNREIGGAENSEQGKSSLPWAKDIVYRFLDEYQAIVAGRAGKKSQKIAHEDMESQWRDCKTEVGKQVRIGHRRKDNNPERWYTLEREFELCAYQVTNRLYLLYDAQHANRFLNYDVYYGEDRDESPVTYINWFDAKMFAIWSGCVILTEEEWEYAARAECVNADGSQPQHFWPDNEFQVEQRAWIPENSGGKLHKVGHRRGRSGAAATQDPDTRNKFGLYDMLGNVWEWQSNRYESSDVSRSVRGGSFFSGAVRASCSDRGHSLPMNAYRGDGCRVARAKSRKP